jgi:hypothetical protein
MAKDVVIALCVPGSTSEKYNVLYGIGVVIDK